MLQESLFQAMLVDSCRRLKKAGEKRDKGGVLCASFDRTLLLNISTFNKNIYLLADIERNILWWLTGVDQLEHTRIDLFFARSCKRFFRNDIGFNAHKSQWNRIIGTIFWEGCTWCMGANVRSILFIDVDADLQSADIAYYHGWLIVVS